MKYFPALFIAAFSLFSMFFGGGNLVFPLAIGVHTSSPLLSIIGFILSSIILPFYGVLIGIYFKGDYKECLGAWGKPFAHLMIFSLLLFWIPLGSGPRCNILAYGALCEIGFQKTPLWVYSLFYSILVYFLTLKRRYVLDILGRIVTPFLIFFLFTLIFALFQQPIDCSLIGKMAFEDFFASLLSGYNTMDFIAAIFFSSAIIELLREKQKEAFRLKFVRNVCLIAIALLTVVYLGMFLIGLVHKGALETISGARFLATVGHIMLGDAFKMVTFMIISLSVLSTSMALSLVFSEYLHLSLFRDKVSYEMSLLISVFITFFMSVMGFENLSAFISVAMGVLYPLLLIIATLSVAKKYFAKKADPLNDPL